MLLTVLMFVVLIVSFALTFWLVKFSENIIVRSKPLSADASAVPINGARNPL